MQGRTGRKHIKMSVMIGHASPQDVLQILALEQACFAFPHTEEQLRHELEDDVYDLLVAKEGEAVLGYAGLSHILEEGYITNVAVWQKDRRRGIGNQLMAALDQAAEKHCLSFISLEVRESNQAAIGLYEKNGYCRTGMIPNCYSQPKENAVVMTKQFTERELS